MPDSSSYTKQKRNTLQQITLWGLVFIPLLFTYCIHPSGSDIVGNIAGSVVECFVAFIVTLCALMGASESAISKKLLTDGRLKLLSATRFCLLVALFAAVGYLKADHLGALLGTLGGLGYGYAFAYTCLEDDKESVPESYLAQAGREFEKFDASIKPAEESLKELETRRNPFGHILARHIEHHLAQPMTINETAIGYVHQSMECLFSLEPLAKTAEVVKQARGLSDKIEAASQRVTDLRVRLDKCKTDQPCQPGKEQPVRASSTPAASLESLQNKLTQAEALYPVSAPLPAQEVQSSVAEVPVHADATRLLSCMQDEQENNPEVHTHANATRFLSTAPDEQAEENISQVQASSGSTRLLSSVLDENTSKTLACAGATRMLPDKHATTKLDVRPAAGVATQLLN